MAFSAPRDRRRQGIAFVAGNHAERLGQPMQYSTEAGLVRCSFHAPVQRRQIGRDPFIDEPLQAHPHTLALRAVEKLAPRHLHARPQGAGAAA